MRRTLLIVFAAIVLLGVAAAVLAPATLFAPRVERATGGALVLRGVEGTVWRGRGVLDASGAQLPFGWTLSAAPLLRGELQALVASFDAQGTLPRATITATREKVQLRNVEATLPANLITNAVPNMQKLGLTANGEIALASPRLDWTPATFDGDVRAVWRMATLALPPLPPLDLGELTATLVADGKRLAGPVTNQGGDLDIRGDVSLGADRSAAVTLTLTPRRSDNTALSRLLSSIGTPVGNGWRISWQTPGR